MKRFVAVLAVGAALSGLGVAGAAQATAQTTGTVATPSATTCAYGPVGIVRNQVCVTVDGGLVSAAGYSTPARSDWIPQSVSYSLNLGITGGVPLETENLTGIVPRGGLAVGYVASTVPCGSSVTATLQTVRQGWPPATATVTVPVTC
ncbi:MULTISPECIES: hypothetical protein [unclassified Kitasatospora]|uniref:hypothetical protein n=1 Tax=unclassified Kitasatospora TaxID=2633591 RepID=UPI00382D82E0